MRDVNLIKRGQLIFIGSFLLLIALGTLLLKSPLVTHSGQPLAWVDALFTATSASCVTGLTTVTIGGFNGVGQAVILLLIQVGGLGFMSLSAFIVLLLGHKFSYSNSLMFSNLNDNFSLRSMEELILMITSYTLLIEFIGWLLLFPGFYWIGGYGFWESFYYSFFHAISAFCNAGLSPIDDSLIGQPAYLKLVVAALIILGGLGIYVIYDFIHYRRHHRLAVHTKLVLVATAVLIAAGAVAIKFCQDGAETIRWIDSLFMSVSARTAGFNSVPMDILSPSSVSILVVLMLIGAAPGSTGGGIKVTAVALAFMAVYNTIKGNTVLVLFHREIPVGNILKGFTMIIIYVVLTVLGTISLSAISGVQSEDAAFETASALGTVGLSLGFSMESDTLSRLLLVAYMFIGRVGPFTIFLFLLGREKQTQLKYPEERIVIG